MANEAFIVNTTVTWTPPGTPENSGVATLATSGVENAQSVGKHDILTSISPASVLSIPFGSVDAAKVAIVENLMTTEIGLRLNGAVANVITLGPGQRFILEGAVAGGTTPLTQLDIEIITAPTATEFVLWWIFGD